MAETRIIIATFELLYGTAEFKSTDTTRSDRLAYSYKGSKFTYVPEEWIDLEPWTDTESEFETKLLRDGAMHFAGNWLETLVGIDLEFHGAESQAFMVDGIVFERQPADFSEHRFAKGLQTFCFRHGRSVPGRAGPAARDTTVTQ